MSVANRPAIEVIGEDRCTGCFGCSNSCPINAIEMKINEIGFYMPSVDRDICNKCGICQHHCPVITTKNDHSPEPTFYAAKTKDAELQMQSSSGGIFGELAKKVIDRSGTVFGAGWDEDLELVHHRIDRKDELSTIQGSKYIQSDIGEAYQEIVTIAEGGDEVLFCGTPCQVGALNTFIMHRPKIRDNIATCDLVCHGVPSNLLFRKYLTYLEELYTNHVASISFRSKEHGWKDYSMKITFRNGKRYIVSHKRDNFMRFYLRNISLRSSCYNCPFSTLPRFGDITLGDLWGVTKEVYDYYGVSIVLANNSKGVQMLEELAQEGRIKTARYSSNIAIKSNPRLKRGDFRVPVEREAFLRDLQTEPFEILFNKYVREQNIFERLKKTIGYWRFRLLSNRKKVW